MAAPTEKRGIIHADQGAQYGSEDWIRFCRDHNLDPSMSRRGNCWDNAVAESFFSSLKKERIKNATIKPVTWHEPISSTTLRCFTSPPAAIPTSAASVPTPLRPPHNEATHRLPNRGNSTSKMRHSRSNSTPFLAIVSLRSCTWSTPNLCLATDSYRSLQAVSRSLSVVTV